MKNQAENVEEDEIKDQMAAGTCKGARAGEVDIRSSDQHPLDPMADDIALNTLIRGIGDLFDPSLNVSPPGKLHLTQTMAEVSDPRTSSVRKVRILINAIE